LRSLIPVDRFGLPSSLLAERLASAAGSVFDDARGPAIKLKDYAGTLINAPAARLRRRV